MELDTGGCPADGFDDAAEPLAVAAGIDGSVGAELADLFFLAARMAEGGAEQADFLKRYVHVMLLL